ncbi:DAK [Bugula neritina]|uniref:DAK n=1 Tax=Bugula neritina TaxID=10212 RepID=A0A7J7K6G0_BUGNE|nr:DAK [Bugula neritina]
MAQEIIRKSLAERKAQSTTAYDLKKSSSIKLAGLRSNAGKSSSHINQVPIASKSIDELILDAKQLLRYLVEMTSKKIINSSETAVSDAIEGLVMVNSGLTTMCGGRVVIRKDVDAIKQKSQVTIISGGGSGHEPAWAGYVGPGLLTAAVCGNIFASPPSQIIYETILRCASDNPAGTLVVVKNYTGDRVNFGLAIERAKALGLKCEMVVAAEDCALTSADRSAGRRGLCGSMLIDKVAGAMSEDGKCLEDIVSTCRQVNISMGTIGVSLGPCCLPGSSQPLFTLGSEEVELGLDKGEKVAVVINNLGGTSYLELNIVAKEILSLCASAKDSIIN